MIKKLVDLEIDAEIIAAFAFIVISGIYIEAKYGFGQIFDTLLLWMFPASVMVFLTLSIVKVVQRFYRKHSNESRYIRLRPRGQED